MIGLYEIARFHLDGVNIDTILADGHLSHHELISIIYYLFIIDIVDDWLQELFPDEQEIVKLRIFEKRTFDNISVQLGYCNHSSVVRKYKTIISKIRELADKDYE